MYTLIPYGHRANDLSSMFDEFDRRFFGADAQVPAFRTDIKDEGDHFLLQAELPGFRKEDIDLSVENGVLTITARHEETRQSEDGKGSYVCRERRSGSFCRSFDVSGIQENGISASYENGVLELTLPKQQEQQPQSRRIAIQ